jgi:type IV secretory pathway TrbL component
MHKNIDSGYFDCCFQIQTKTVRSPYKISDFGVDIVKKLMDDNLNTEFIQLIFSLILM